MKILLAFFTLYTSIAFADVDVPSPPQSLKANEVINSNAAETLITKINNLIEKKDDIYTKAKIIQETDKQIILNYEYQYNWRTSSNIESTLIYINKDNTWKLTANLSGRISSKNHIIDLTGDGISELILTSVHSFRSNLQSEQRIMVYDAMKNKYIASNLLANSDSSADCNGQKNINQEMSTQQQVPLPYIIIEEKVERVKQTSCDLEPVSKSTSKYVWSEKQSKFIPLGTQNVTSTPAEAESMTATPAETKSITSKLVEWLTSW